MVASPFVADEHAAEEGIESYIEEGDDHLPEVCKKYVRIEGRVSLIYVSVAVQSNEGDSTDRSVWQKID